MLYILAGFLALVVPLKPTYHETSIDLGIADSTSHQLRL